MRLDHEPSSEGQTSEIATRRVTSTATRRLMRRHQALPLHRIPGSIEALYSNTMPTYLFSLTRLSHSSTKAAAYSSGFTL